KRFDPENTKAGAQRTQRRKEGQSQKIAPRSSFVGGGFPSPRCRAEATALHLNLIQPGCENMKNTKVDAARVWKQLHDHLIPQLRLSVLDRSVYSHLLRHSRLEGKPRIRFSLAWLARGVRLSPGTRSSIASSPHPQSCFVLARMQQRRSRHTGMAAQRSSRRPHHQIVASPVKSSLAQPERLSSIGSHAPLNSSKRSRTLLLLSPPRGSS